MSQVIMEHLELFRTLHTVLFFVWGYVTLWFLLALYAKRNDIADIAWGPGIALVAMTAFVVTDATNVRAGMLAVLVFLWGVRLSLHITRRLRGKKEDFRYQAWRDEWGKWFIPRSYAQVFLLQGFLMVLVGYPVVHASVYGGTSFTAFDVVGLMVWAFGIAFEAMSDRQLRTFLATQPTPGTVCDVGLWKYSRHPNYFGEIILWWGIALPVLAVPYGAWALIGPVTITLLIVFVSGIPLLEKRLMERPEYRAYASRTSILIPLPPKRILVEKDAGR